MKKNSHFGSFAKINKISLSATCKLSNVFISAKTITIYPQTTTQRLISLIPRQQFPHSNPALAQHSTPITPNELNTSILQYGRNILRPHRTAPKP